MTKGPEAVHEEVMSREAGIDERDDVDTGRARIP